MRIISLGVDTKETGEIWAFDKGAIQLMLTEIVNFILQDPSGNPETVVPLFTNDSVEHFGEPPNTVLVPLVPNSEE